MNIVIIRIMKLKALLTKFSSDGAGSSSSGTIAALFITLIVQDAR